MERKVPESILEDTLFCPGCGHGILVRLVAEVLDELGIREKALCATGVGCSCWLLEMLGVDQIQAEHGRAAAIATGIQAIRPNAPVFTYQGDGDATCIGLSDSIFAAQRNSNIVQIYVNNGLFGMTGGQMAPTTLIGQKTTSCKNGRDPSVNGYPMDYLKMVSTMNIAYSARGTLTDVKEINKTKKYIKNAFEAQLNGEGFSVIEVVSPCPTNWNLTPLKAMQRIKDEVLPVYPLGEFVKRGERIEN